MSKIKLTVEINYDDPIVNFGKPPEYSIEEWFIRKINTSLNPLIIRLKGVNSLTVSSTSQDKEIASLKAALLAHEENEGDECPLCATENRITQAEKKLQALLQKFDCYHTAEIQEVIDCLKKSA